MCGSWLEEGGSAVIPVFVPHLDTVVLLVVDPEFAFYTTILFVWSNVAKIYHARPYCIPVVVELFFFQIAVFCSRPPSATFGSKYDVLSCCLTYYDASFETATVSLHERVLEFLL